MPLTSPIYNTIQYITSTIIYEYDILQYHVKIPQLRKLCFDPSPSVRPSIWPSTIPSVRLPVCLYVCIFVYSSTCFLFVWLFVYLNRIISQNVIYIYFRRIFMKFCGKVVGMDESIRIRWCFHSTVNSSTGQLFNISDPLLQWSSLPPEYSYSWFCCSMLEAVFSECFPRLQNNLMKL